MHATPMVDKHFRRSVASELTHGTTAIVQRKAYTSKLQPSSLSISYRGLPFGPYRVTANRGDSIRPVSPSKLLTERGSAEWSLFIIFLVVGLACHRSMFPSDGKSFYRRFARVFFWLLLAVAYAIILHQLTVAQDLIDWSLGYVYELIFGFENLFVFHLTLTMFNPPRQSIRTVLCIVMVCQIIFEFGFFLGLAHLIQSIKAMPYLLGTWLIYVGYTVIQEDVEESEETSEAVACWATRAVLGHRFQDKYSHCGSFFVADEPDGKWRCTKLLPLTACLVIVDFCLEVDVCLTKIEEFPSAYIAFSSSCMASLLIPDMFSLTARMFAHYTSLKYCISIVLIFFGLELWLHAYISMPDIVKCVGIVLFMGLWVLVARFAFHEEYISQVEDKYSSSTMNQTVLATSQKSEQEDCANKTVT